MAKTFYAATKIKFGSRTEDGSQDGKYESKVFEPGQEVKGLSAEDMKGLWTAGALTDQKPESAEDEENDEDQEGEESPNAPKPPTKSAPTKAAASGSASRQSNS